MRRSVGALYRELRAMEGEGLVEAVRTERVGRRPARTVYAITGEGSLELAMLREQAIRNIHWWPDPLGVALSFAEAGTDRDELASWLRTRRETLALTAAQLAEDRERMVAKGYLGPFQATVMYRGQLHAEAEVRWHDEFATVLAGLPPDEECIAQTSELTGAPGEGTSDSHGDHCGARACPHVHQPQAHRGGGARGGPHRG
jgi:DNA-binding PadR family transcriptional regulator